MTVKERTPISMNHMSYDFESQIGHQSSRNDHMNDVSTPSPSSRCIGHLLNTLTHMEMNCSTRLQHWKLEISIDHVHMHWDVCGMQDVQRTRPTGFKSGVKRKGPGQSGQPRQCARDRIRGTPCRIWNKRSVRRFAAIICATGYNLETIYWD
ncbi:hypothetical protein N7468_008188 [Penicillium chermesinum]|uniref:Uncharacterized protein n=1 Tax=Penicillium chermesinum TaxID=63820 RepID=A0A9W9NPK7_9EURO|nr:uncharacterized protein N7468_008188 [Penicillium chermesinum]KAJ5223646.1 hypothetical protein N7468_008188 [Penicillium chermesinum]